MTTSRPFRFGVLAENARTVDELVTTAQKAESLGYSTLLIRDHLVAEPFGDQLAPMIALAVVATATRKLRIGTLVLANDFRHPTVLAKEVTTLDHISRGRFELGLGAGWLRAEYESAGLPFDRPGLRVERLAESVRALKELVSGKPVTFTGDHYAVDSLATFPAAEQRPRPPVLIGAGGERMLRLAGREADIVGILPKALPAGAISGALAERTGDMIKRKIDWIRGGAGDRFPHIELSTVISPHLTDDVEDAAERFAAARGWGSLEADQVLDLPSVFIGPAERIAASMRERREEYGFSYYVVSDAAMERFAPVVGDLAGR